MWVTILTPLFNGIEYFEECYKSIINQTDQNYIWIIGVNGHGDENNSIYTKLKSYNSIQIKIINYDTKGKVDTLNKMMSEVNTPYIAILDIDDIWFPNKLEIQKQVLDTYKEIDVLGTNLQYIGELNHVPNLPSGVITLDILFQINPVVNSSVIIKTNLGSWRNFYNLEDYDLWFRCLLEDKIVVTLPQPLIYHRVHQNSAFNNSGVQDLKSFMEFYENKIKNVTVVSAYFPIESKFSVSNYMNWMEFWKDLDCNLVFFTSKEVAPIIELFRINKKEKTEIIIMEFSELVAFKKYGVDFWIQQKTLDHEKYHTPSLYALWYEKKEFVRKAIDLNKFNSEKYVWCDAGICRNKEWIQLIKSFPNGLRISNNKFTVLRITDFEQEENFQYINCVGGGILAGTKEKWLQFADDYDIIMNEFIDQTKFVGKDQTIIAHMYLKNNNFFTLLPCIKEFDEFTKWFSLLFYFST
jgi:glycosyltransferase involved in cell wall biosynthesis